MFDQIAGRYDLLNRLMSMGIDQSWRRKTVTAMELPPNARVLDLATGTGDLALMIARRHPDARVVGSDPSKRMLEVGIEKVKRIGLTGRVELQEGDAQALPFDDDSFDGCCIAFGIRNVPDRDAALAEMARVTKPGGRVAILELSEPHVGLLSPVARFHVRQVVPLLGGMLSGSREYRYLQKSIAAFPPADEFAEQMRVAGLNVLDIKSFTFGACTLFVGEPWEAS
ncbi:MAG: bifunctional demethylmenaquinone methyltransferase/2-methoxy-6-polyprenyl-1,4-benzoquinol methylase UbiE [Myxococcales bacterium]|nr:bifunctional demethylmenaquinone methyltransferase/2-methoxy-6-polyprenyl-1,4-benzoquinol methylase UbiE [Myxococcales bacterium]MDH3845182.1 bifunctional demethylmenaquinone methyltransferase/2-methoxy-6-polyprenyl-1,4-benzoquinol methylase UbiE [Myxococcales bacterium]